MNREKVKSLEKDSVRKTIIRRVGEAIGKYSLIKSGDRLLVAVSGGKDSWVLLDVLQHFLKVSPERFELIPVTIDIGFSESELETVKSGYRQIAPNLPWKIIKTKITEIALEKNSPGKHLCAFCARLRRGALYRIASENHCNKIALGHHADDAIETTLISCFYEGNLTSLPPKVKTDDPSLSVIRPLILVWENEIIQYSDERNFPTITCERKNASGGRRKRIKNLLEQLELEHPEIKRNFLAALQKIMPERFLDNKWL